MSWWEEPYPGAPMVKVKGFPRPLYPPGVKGHASSGDGPDVVAYKRTVSRAGRWPWQKFDDSYSAGFANGNGPNVINSGVAGVQRQGGIDDTGFIGEVTFNLLRSIVIPEGLAHAGETAMDATAVNLINQAFAMFSEPPAGDVPDLGPIFHGSKSVLDQDLTHATSGLDYYPAFDDAFGEGNDVLAPEGMEITKASSSNPGDACYALGDSGLMYWFGHLTMAPNVGATFEKGELIGVTCVNNVGGGPHCHLGINVEGLWGTGKQMSHHSDYTHGGPLVGDQLAAGHPL